MSIPSANRVFDRKRLRFIAFWVFSIGLLCHGYCFLNAYLSHDSLYSIYEPGPGLMLSVGRYGRVIYRMLRGSFTLPALNGFLSLLYLTLAVYLLTDILSIRKKSFLILTCGILVANSTVSLINATYLHDADAYSLALLLASAGAWIALRRKYGGLISIVFYAASLSIYQAFINVVIFLWLFLGLTALLDGEKPTQVLWKTALRMLSVAAAMALYYLGYRLILRVTGIEPSALSTIGSVTFGISSLLSCLGKMLDAERRWFFRPIGTRSGLLLGINLTLTVLSFLALGSLTVKKKLSPTALLLELVFLLAMPLGMDAVALVSDTYHEITLYALFLTYPLMLSLLERYLALPGKSFKGTLCALLLAVMLFDNALYSNTIYLKKQLESQQTLSVYTRILDRMEQTEGYVSGETPIVLVGSHSHTVLDTRRKGFDYRPAGLTQSLAPTYYDTMKNYFHYYLGNPANFGDGDIQWQVAHMEEMYRMPLYPAPGSVRMIDGVMVVKLSQPARED